MKSFYLTAFKIIIVTFQKPRSLGYFSNQGPTSRSTLKIHFVNSQDRNFILTQSAGSFQGTNLRNCEGFKWGMIFYQWRWWKENWREEKWQKGICFTIVPINTCFRQPKHYMRVIYYFCLVVSCHQPAQKSATSLHLIWEYTEAYWKKILAASWVSLLLFSFLTALWWNTNTVFLPFLVLPKHITQFGLN